MATIGVPAIESLLSMLTDPNCSAFQVGLINLALSFIGSKAPDAFDHALQSDNAEIRIAAVTALAEQIQSGTSLNARALLIRALSDPASEVRAEAATMTGKTLEPEEVRAQLHDLLSDQDPQVRKNTALSLMKMESFESISQIKNAFDQESNDQVKAVLEVAYKQLERMSE